MLTAGRTVLFSGLTVAVAMAALIVFPQRFLYSIGVAGATVAVISALIALLVVPAILALLGRADQLARDPPRAAPSRTSPTAGTGSPGG